MATGFRGGRGKRAGGPTGMSRAPSRDAPSREAPSRHTPTARVPGGLGRGELSVNGYSEGWLRRGFPWVYRDELTGGDPPSAAGSSVRLRAPDGRLVASGIWSPVGKVAVRVWRADDGPIDASLIRERLQAARRRRVLPPHTDAWRWVHGENDDMPGVRVDVWGSQLAIALEDPSLSVLLPLLVEGLVELGAPSAIWRADRPSDEPSAAVEVRGLLWGEAPEAEIVVSELGLRFLVRPGSSHDVGLFCDMREARAWLAPHLAGRRVLNLFAHTGAFSVQAAARGAAEVVTVDLSAPWLQRARLNMSLNNLDPAVYRWMEEDALAALDLLRRKGERFDLIIADPPSFSHGPRGEWSVSRDLGRLVASCCRVLDPGGWLMVASNHGGLSPKDFGAMIQSGALKAETPLRLLHEAGTPLDFPAALSFPESRYLKCWVLGR